MKKLLLIGTLFLLCVGLVTSQASAFSLKDGYLGPVEFKFTGWSTDQTLYATPEGQSENVWLIAQITSITDPDGNGLWSNIGTEELTAMVYGAYDLSIVPGGDFGYQIYNLGLSSASQPGTFDGNIHMDIYLDDPGDYTSAGGPSARTAYDAYPTVTETAGDLFLSTVFVAGWIDDNALTPAIDESLATLYQDATSETTPASGDGFFYASITGGSYEWMFDSNGFVATNGNIADLHGKYSFEANPDGSATYPNGFAQHVHDPLVGTAVPEPATMLLLGSGLIVLAGFGRKKRFFTKKS